MEKKLSELGFDEKGVVKKIEEDFRLKIAGMGIRVGKKVRMTTRQPIKGPVVIEIERTNTSLGLGLADKIIVDVEE